MSNRLLDPTMSVGTAASTAARTDVLGTQTKVEIFVISYNYNQQNLKTKSRTVKKRKRASDLKRATPEHGSMMGMSAL